MASWQLTGLKALEIQNFSIGWKTKKAIITCILPKIF